MIVFKPNKALWLEAIERNSEHPFGVMIDVGSGAVSRYAGLFARVNKVIRLDINQEYNPDILASAENIPVEDMSFDSIICTQVIGDINEPLNLIKEFYRILRPGGVVLLTESFMNELHGEPHDFWRYTPYGLEYIFKAAGFEIIKTEKIGGYFAVRAQNMIRYAIGRFHLGTNGSLFGIFLRFALRVYGKIMLHYDRLDNREIGSKFALGWLIIAKKVIR